MDLRNLSNGKTRRRKELRWDIDPKGMSWSLTNVLCSEKHSMLECPQRKETLNALRLLSNQRRVEWRRNHPTRVGCIWVVTNHRQDLAWELCVCWTHCEVKSDCWCSWTSSWMGRRHILVNSKPRDKVTRIEAGKKFEPNEDSQFREEAYFWIGEGSRH